MAEDKSAKSPPEGAAAIPIEDDTKSPKSDDPMSKSPKSDDPMSEPLMSEEDETASTNDDEEKSTSTPGDEEKMDGSEDDTPSWKTKAPIRKSHQQRMKRRLSFDVTDMYPEMSALTDKKRSEWNYNDPETIRALWLEANTNALTEWKMKFSIIKNKKKPTFEVRGTAAQALRQDYIKTKKEKEKSAQERYERIVAKGSLSANFREVSLPTNLATEMRYKYIRNNPPVPRYYLEHFDTYRKPPFRLFGVSACRALLSEHAHTFA